MAPKLDIIVTHYREPWSDCRKFFDMLSIQRGVNRDDYNVIIVQDGETGSLEITNNLRYGYSFTPDIYVQSQGGVSKARNTGLTKSSAPWVMYCDCDDMFYSCDSLNRILTSIDQAEDKADLLWSPFWIEYNTKDWRKSIKEWNSVFIHAKLYRRQFLIDHGIKFDPELSYSEDALFNAEVCMCISPHRIGRIPEITYMWCQRPESLSSYTGGQAERNINLYKMRLKRCRAYDKHGMHYEAETSAVRAVLDYYWELNSDKGVPDGGTFPEWLDRVRNILHEYPACVRHVTTDDWNKLCRVAEEEARAKHFYRDDNPPIEQWIYSLQERR